MIIFVFLGLIFLSSSSWVVYDRYHFLKERYINLPGLDAKILVNSNFKLSPPEIENVRYSTSEDTIYTYQLRSPFAEYRKPISTFQLTLRKLDNGDVFVFSHLRNEESKGPSRVDVKLHMEESVQDFKVHNFNPKVIEHIADKKVGLDTLTNPFGIYESTKHSVLVSKTFVYKKLVKTYEDLGTSTIRELNNETDTHRFLNHEGDSVISMGLASFTGSISENWMLISNEPLFSNPKHRDEHIEETLVDYKLANRWVTPEGKVIKLAWAIEPFTRKGYGLNLGATPDTDALKEYKKTKERIYYDFIMHSISALEQFKNRQQGSWLTEYTSTWVKDSYGIRAPYFDTRHNYTIALFLMNAADVLDKPFLKAQTRPYADYLIQQKDVIRTKTGYFIPDYTSTAVHETTHVSLNHALAEMNFLLDFYHITQEKKYVDTALQIRRAVEDTGEHWINPKNGDLYYEMKPNFEYLLVDYPTLTLEDLLLSQQLFKQLSLDPSPVFTKLIESKLQFVVNSNISIPPFLRDLIVKEGYGKFLPSQNR